MTLAVSIASRRDDARGATPHDYPGRLGSPGLAPVIDFAGAVSPDLMLREKELMSYKGFPPLQAPETYNLDGILKKIQESNASHPSE